MKRGKKHATAMPHRYSQSRGIASTVVFSDFPHVATTDTNSLKTTWITAKVSSHLESDTFLVVIAVFTVIWLIMGLCCFAHGLTVVAQIGLLFVILLPLSAECRITRISHYT